MEAPIIISIIATLVSISGFVFGMIQFIDNNRVRRAQFFKEIVDKLRFDDSLIDAMTLLDYHDDWYDDDFPQSALEAKVDKLFAYLSYVCYLYNNKVISLEEFELIEYKIKRTCQNKSTQSYFKFLYQFSRINNIKHTFDDLIQYMKKSVFGNDPDTIYEFENSSRFAIKRDFILLNVPQDNASNDHSNDPNPTQQNI